jgi:DNA-directed RNA polymerase specialized sigma24 family protein
VAVFRACALEGEPPAQVAERFQLKPNAVYQIKNRLFARVQTILGDLEEGTRTDANACEDMP